MPRLLALLVVFGASAAVLVLELMAARLLGPYVGLSLQTYTGIIGTVLAAIAVGAWAGGALADRYDPWRLIGPAIVLGGLLSLLAVPLVHTFGDSLRGDGSTAAIPLAAAGFFLPAAALSTVTPMVAKLQLRTVAETGGVVGRLSAASTAGALVGTFLTGFVLVEAFPSTNVVVGTGLALVAAGVALALGSGRAGPGLAAVAVLLTVPATAAAIGSGDACTRETTYACARILDDPRHDGAQLLVLDTVRHATVDVDDPTWLGFAYTRSFAAAIDGLPAGPLAALHVGGGGFTMPRWLAATRPGSRSVVLEIDGGLVDLVRDRLGLVTGPDLVARVGDARTTLPEEPAGAYDVVVGDAFGGLSVPWHLTTREFARQVQERLRPDGLYVLNVIDYPPLRFGRAEVATLREVFPHVALLARLDVLARRDGGNLVIVASGAPLDLAGLRQRLGDAGDGWSAIDGAELDAWVDGAEPLRDDHAPVDQLVSRG